MPRFFALFLLLPGGLLAAVTPLSPQPSESARPAVGSFAVLPSRLSAPVQAPLLARTPHATQPGAVPAAAHALANPLLGQQRPHSARPGRHDRAGGQRHVLEVEPLALTGTVFGALGVAASIVGFVVTDIALILGIGGAVLGLVAVLLAATSFSRQKRGGYSGRGLAILALVLGLAAIGLGLVVAFF